MILGKVGVVVGAYFARVARVAVSCRKRPASILDLTEFTFDMGQTHPINILHDEIVTMWERYTIRLDL